MQKCPKCGYDEGVDWPVLLWVVSFTVLYIVFIAAADYAPRNYRFMGYGAFTIFTAGTLWKVLRNRAKRLKATSQ
jgi:hypothetical protein